MSHVTCHMSHVLCQMFFSLFFFGQSDEAYWWGVCYQWGPPRLVSKASHCPAILEALKGTVTQNMFALKTGPNGCIHL